VLGINLKGALSDLLSSPEVKRILAWLEGKLNRLTDALAALERMLGYEHGLPVKDVPPHDPRRLPYVHRAEGVSDLRLNVAAALGKPATRGEIMNYGDTKALLVFIRSDGASEERVDQARRSRGESLREPALPPGGARAVKFEPRVSRRGKGYFAEIALARGPRVMAITGSGTFEELFGYAWLALLDRRERRLRLFQAQAGGAPSLSIRPPGTWWPTNARARSGCASGTRCAAST